VLQELILEKTEGVPFFIEELIKSLKKLNVIEKKDTRYQLARDIQKVAIPSTIQDVIMARVDALPERAKEVIQAGSAIEREFSYELIKHIIAMTQDELLTNLSILKDLELIYERGIFPKSTYIFKHALTQEVVYGSILKDRTKKYHEKIAQAMEKMYADRLEEFYPTLAYQYSKTDNHPKAYEYLKLSGIKAFSNYANQESYNFFKEALQSLDQSPDTDENKKEKIKLILLINNPSVLLGYPEGSFEILKTGEELCRELQDHKSLASFYGYISTYYTLKDMVLEALEFTEPRFVEAIRTKDVNLIAPLSWGLIAIYSQTGDQYKILDQIPEVIDLLETNRKEYEFFDLPFNMYAHLIDNIGLSLASTGSLKEGKTYLEKGSAFAHKINDINMMGESEICYAYYYLTKGEGNLVIHHSQNAIKLCEEANNPLLKNMASCALGVGYGLIGDLYSAEKYIKAVYEIQKATSAVLGLKL
jgi:hypothetical protein